MGQTLSEPITTKETTFGGDERLTYGASCMQGWRISMEDAHTTLPNMLTTDDKKISFFAVFDGHGGAAAAKYAGLHLHHKLSKDEQFKLGLYTTALKNTFLNLDQDMRKDPIFEKEFSGCTVVVCIITEDLKLYCANAGDSRAVLASKGETKPLSFDHKPTNPEETKRIITAGGFVDFGRVNGNLALSRAFGDFDFKQNSALTAEEQIVTCNPEITEHQITEVDDFIIVACDGIWDCMKNEAAVMFVYQKVYEGYDLTVICELMMESCLSPMSDMFGCDNMTLVIVALLNGKSKQEWIERVKNTYLVMKKKQEAEAEEELKNQDLESVN